MFVPLVAGLLGVVIVGHMMRRAVLGFVLVPILVAGWSFSLVATSGVMPPGLTLAIGLGVTVAVYPFDASDTRRILAACVVGAIFAVVGAFLRPMNDTLPQAIAVSVNVVAVVTYAIASVVSYRSTQASSRQDDSSAQQSTRGNPHL